MVFIHFTLTISLAKAIVSVISTSNSTSVIPAATCTQTDTRGYNSKFDLLDIALLVFLHMCRLFSHGLYGFLPPYYIPLRTV